MKVNVVPTPNSVPRNQQSCSWTFFMSSKEFTFDQVSLEKWDRWNNYSVFIRNFELN